MSAPSESNSVAQKPSLYSVATLGLTQTATFAAIAYFHGHSYQDKYYDYLGLPKQFFGNDIYDTLLKGGPEALIFIGAVVPGIILIGLAGYKLAAFAAPKVSPLWAPLLILLCLNLGVIGIRSSQDSFTQASTIAASASLMALITEFLFQHDQRRIPTDQAKGTNTKPTINQLSGPHYLRLTTYFFLATALVGFILMSAHLAGLDGKKAAQDGFHPSNFPLITLYSAKDLRIIDPDVTVINRPAEHFKFEYGNLRLVAYAGHKFLLISSQWSPKETAFLVTDEPEIRININATT